MLCFRIPAVIVTSTLIVFCIFLRCMCKFFKWCCRRRVNKRNRMRRPQNVGTITDTYQRTTPTSDAVRRRSPERESAAVVLEMSNIPLENTPPPPKKRSWFCFRKKSKNSPTPSEVEVVTVGADSQSSEEF